MRFDTPVGVHCRRDCAAPFAWREPRSALPFPADERGDGAWRAHGRARGSGRLLAAGCRSRYVRQRAGPAARRAPALACRGTRWPWIADARRRVHSQSRKGACHEEPRAPHRPRPSPVAVVLRHHRAAQPLPWGRSRPPRAALPGVPGPQHRRGAARPLSCGRVV